MRSFCAGDWLYGYVQRSGGSGCRGGYEGGGNDSDCLHPPGSPRKRVRYRKGIRRRPILFVEDPLDYYKDKKPSEKDLSQEKAAEMGAQLLWKMFGVKLDGATIYMGYDPGTATFPRESWSGDVRFGKSRTAGGYELYFSH